MNRIKNTLLNIWRYAPGACCALAFTIGAAVGASVYVRYFAHTAESIAISVILFLFSIVGVIRVAAFYDLMRD